MAKIRVLVVDDSALMRQLLSDLLGSDPELEVVGTATDPYNAWDKLKALNPDVMTLDVEMPRMDGITLLERLMTHRPMPVVMVSSLTEKGQEVTLRALELGAVDFVTKPKLDMTNGTIALADEIIAKVKLASRCQPKTRIRTTARSSVSPALRTTHKVIAIGTSTGGCEALSEVLTHLPADSPGIVAVIHMPEGFTKSYAARLDRNCAIRVSEGKDGDRVMPGHALIAPGNFHMAVVRSGVSVSVKLSQSESVNRHRPAVDVLFRSCADQLGPNAVGAIMTGMGDDGARGLAEMRRAGARTIAQDEATCVVYGMPREAVALGAAEFILPLERISEELLRLAATS